MAVRRTPKYSLPCAPLAVLAHAAHGPVFSDGLHGRDAPLPLAHVALAYAALMIWTATHSFSFISLTINYSSSASSTIHAREFS